MSSTEAPRPQHDDLAPARPTRARRMGRLAGVGAIALLLSACEGAQSALDPQGPWAQKEDDLFRIVFAIAVVVFVLVQGLVIYASVRFREKDGDSSMPVQVHGSTKLEVTWTVIPAVILAAISVPTVALIFDLETDDPDAVVIEVIGHRWWWEYRYPAGEEFGDGFTTANELVIPTDTNVRLEMWSEEAGGPGNAVIHSYWVPKLNGKKDVVPGRVNTLKLVAVSADTYLGQCAEYCGLSHANMRQRVVSKTPADFDAWVAAQLAVPEIPAEGSAERAGYDLFTTNACIGCHAVAGTPAQGVVGPDLTHLFSRSTFAGSIFDLNSETLFDWVKDAPSMKAMHPNATPSIGMPSFKDSLSDAEIQAIVTYLESLK